MSYFSRTVDRTLGSGTWNIAPAITADQIPERFEIQNSKTDLPDKWQSKLTDLGQSTGPPKEKPHSKMLTSRVQPPKIQEMEEQLHPKADAETQKTKENMDVPKIETLSIKDQIRIEDTNTSIVEPAIGIESSEQIPKNVHFVNSSSKEPEETKPMVAEPVDDLQVQTNQNLAPNALHSQSDISTIHTKAQKTIADKTVTIEGKSEDVSKSLPQSVTEHLIEARKEIQPKEIQPKEIQPKEIQPKEIQPKEIQPKEIQPKEIQPKEIQPKEIQPKENLNQTYDDNITFPVMVPRDPKIVAERRQSATQETVVTINIGRIEVRASTPSSPTPRQPTRFTPPLSLTEYLKQREGDKR